MLITLVLFFVSLGILPYLAYKYDRDCLPGWVIIPNILVAGACIITMWNSYDNYVDMKQHLTNFNIHADAITSYEKFAELDTTKPGAVNPITDLKYQNYQGGIKDLIEDLKYSCIAYNKILVGKKILGNNIIFNWLIIMPDDDMKVIEFSNFLNIKSR